LFHERTGRNVPDRRIVPTALHAVRKGAAMKLSDMDRCNDSDTGFAPICADGPPVHEIALR